MHTKKLSVRISTLRTKVAKIIQGNLKLTPLPWPVLEHVTQALLPGTITLFCGAPGSAKSLMLCQMIAYWHEQGVDAAAYMVEESQDYHLMRMLAQHVGQSGLTEYNWIADNPEIAESSLNVGEDFLHIMTGLIWANPTQAPTFSELANWIEFRAKEGKTLICVDPVTAARADGRIRQCDEEKDFMDKVRRISVAYNLCIVFVTHPKQTFQRPDLGQLAGSASFSRFSHTIFWIQKHDAKFSTVATPIGCDLIEHNRTIHVLKARNGKDERIKMAMLFDPATLNTKECGIIVKKGKTNE